MSEGKPPFIRNVEHPHSVELNTPVKIEMKADWPTPSWEHIDTKIEIFRDQHRINISYLGLRRAGVALQQITSFETYFEVVFPEKGEWQIVVQSRSENWESVIEVN